MALKYLHLIFCQPQIRFFNNYSFRNLQNKKADILHTGGLWDEYGISLEKETNILLAYVVPKNRRSFLQNSIADWKSMKSSILMKYEINIMKIHLQFKYIYFFKYFKSILWFFCSNNPAYMYSLWSRAFVNEPSTICYLIRCKNKLASFISNNEPTVLEGKHL